MHKKKIIGQSTINYAHLSKQPLQNAPDEILAPRGPFSLINILLDTT